MGAAAGGSGRAAQSVEVVKRRQTAGPPLSPHTCAVLLSGWSATLPSGAGVDGDLDDFFDLFQGDDTIAALWCQHEAYLRLEAVRLGVTPRFGPPRRPRFFGEDVAAMLGRVRPGG